MTKTFTTHRRGLFGLFGTGAATAVLAACGSGAQAKSFPVAHSEAEWKKRLTKAEFYVLRQEGTERPYSSPLNEEKRKGVFACAGCGNAVYSSRTKFDSGTGWPSFWDARGRHRHRLQARLSAHRSPLRRLRRASGSHFR